MQLIRTLLIYGCIWVATAQVPARAAACPTPIDSTIPAARNHRLTQQAFLEQYGTDDTSQALITYYFQKRTTNKSLAVGSGLVGFVAAGLAGLVLVLAAGFNLLNFLLIVSLLATAYVNAVLLVVAGTFFIIHNRRRLHRWLTVYHRGGGLPGKIRRKKSFLRLLKQDSSLK